MKRIATLVALLVVCMALLAPASLARAETVGTSSVSAPSRQGKIIPGRYIVSLKPGVAAFGLAQQGGFKTRFTYSAVLNGFAADLSLAQVQALKRNPNVLAIEPDLEVTLDATQYMDSTGQPWGLDRIDQRQLPLSRSYTYNQTGAGVNVYVIDTGIQTSHADFGGRASVAYDAVGGNGQDCNGHGTHVAGTIGGRTYGVAKGVRLYAVRVLNCQGSGSNSGIIAGMDWVTRNHRKPAVANMSLGGGYSSTVNSAATRMVNAGVFVAVAAGNSNANACSYSPASASGVFTTAASDRNDYKASFSNYGSCVEGYAPGVSIKSAWLNGGTNSISGTSMASPHVAGVAALYKSAYGDAASSTISNWIITNSTSGVIKSNPSGTPNRLLYKAGL